MPLSLKDLRPCAICGEQLMGEGNRVLIFHVIEEQIATVDRQALNEFAGMLQFFGGKALKLVEMFSPKLDRGVVLEEDQEGGKPHRHFLCHDCWTGIKPTKPLSEWVTEDGE